MAICRELAIN
jgi:hypothetical protein